MISPVSTLMTGAPSAQDDRLLEKAKQLEAAFLSEMLSFTGLGELSETFDGGAGEEQFASFLRAEQAKLMVERGGIGLAAVIFDSLKSKEGPVDEAT